MPVFYCKNCGKKMRAGNEAIGKRGRCNSCNAMMTIPASDEPPPSRNNAADEPPPLPIDDESGVPPPLPSHQPPTPKPTARPVAARRVLKPTGNGKLIFGAMVVVVVIAIGVWFVQKQSARRDTKANPSSTVSEKRTAATNQAAPQAPATSFEQKLLALNDRNQRCFEWMENWRRSLQGAAPEWATTAQSAVEEADRELLEKSAASNARMSAEARAIRAATSGQSTGERLPREVNWTDADSAKIVVLRDKIAEWGYAVLSEQQHPEAALSGTASRMGASGIEDILRKKHAEAKPSEVTASRSPDAVSTAAKKMTFEVIEQPMQKVADFLSTLTKQKIHVDASLTEKDVSIKVTDLTLEEALRRIAAVINADIKLQDGTYFVLEKPKR